MVKSRQSFWKFQAKLAIALLSCSVLFGCSERRKEAARLEAELEAHRKGTSSSVEQGIQAETQQPLDSGVVTSSAEENAGPPDSQVNTETTANQSDSAVESIRDDLPMQETQDSSHPLGVSEDDSSQSSQGSPKDSTPMPARPRDGYTVQIAGTRSSDEANAIVERFKLYGYDAYVAEVSREGRPFFRVRVGRFETEQEAISLKGQLLEQQQIEGWVDQGSW